jgi:hypothetical protein
MTTTTNPTQTQIDTLLAQARSIQRELYALIASRKNPRRFGQLERQLEGIFAQVDTLRGKPADGLKAGDSVTVRGMDCTVRRVLAAGTIQVEAANGAWFTVSGL